MNWTPTPPQPTRTSVPSDKPYHHVYQTSLKPYGRTEVEKGIVLFIPNILCKRKINQLHISSSQHWWLTAVAAWDGPSVSVYY
ncbi:hypothetical protein Pmani_009847 [Petrolisthes manimaculis]|uniref:Uncharacterized protein n=1 Tax=Petrolisthes manimaculis TaxID=1843537 RepID=A0AAE1UHD0_9EUCA|nr:hypothetical protein Pmani_009847 [Petrolisthes manimaculis]